MTLNRCWQEAWQGSRGRVCSTHETRSTCAHHTDYLCLKGTAHHHPRGRKRHLECWHYRGMLVSNRGGAHGEWNCGNEAPSREGARALIFADRSVFDFETISEDAQLVVPQH